MSKKNANWDRNYILALLGVILAILGLVITITLPELRTFFGLEKETVSSPPEVTNSIEQSPQPAPKIKQEPQEPADPIRYTIHENQAQLVEKAQTSLSIAFHDVLGEKVASLTIAPANKASSTHAVLNGYTQEVTSTAGTFLVQILHVDYQGKKIQIQVTQTSPDNEE